MADDKEKILVIKSILTLHASTGADIHTIRRDYFEQQGEKLESSKELATALMFRIPDVFVKNERYFSKSQESQHIVKLVKEQRQPLKRRYSLYMDRDHVDDEELHTRTSQNFGATRSRSPRRTMRRNDGNNRSRSTVRPSTSNGFANGWQNRAPSPPPTRTTWRPQNDALPLSSFSVRDPRVNNNFDRENDKADETMFRPTTTTQPDVQIQRFAVIADDFIFSMILERTAFNSDAQQNDVVLTPKWSYCVVGQTIADAVTLITQDHLDKPLEPTKVIVNIGAVDISRGTTFRQMAVDFTGLIDTCERLNMQPTITTVLPFSASPNAQEIAWKVHAFNNFLKENFDNVIDLWSCFAIGLSRSLGNLFHSNGVATRFAGRDSDITWEDEQMRLEHRGK